MGPVWAIRLTKLRAQVCGSHAMFSHGIVTIDKHNSGCHAELPLRWQIAQQVLK